MTKATRARQIITAIALGLLAPVIAGSMLWVSTFFPANRTTFMSDTFVQYGFQNVVTEADRTDVTGLPAYTVSFDFDPEQDLMPGFSELDNAIDRTLEEERGVYSITASNLIPSGAGEPTTTFRFQNITPDEFSNGVFEDAYTQFSSIQGMEGIRDVRYSSRIDTQTGLRVVNVEAVRETTRGSHEQVWANVLDALPVEEGTTYTLRLTSERGTSVGSFDSIETKELLVDAEPAWWQMFSRYRGTESTNTYSIQSMLLTFTTADFGTQLEGAYTLYYAADADTGAAAAATALVFIGTPNPANATVAGYSANSGTPLINLSR